MITIRPFHNKYRTGFVVEGHADYAEHGRDIVCSAVSAMTQMIEVGLERYSHTQVEKHSGFLSVEIVKPNTYTDCLMESLMRGLRMIEVSKSQYITIQEESHDARF